jgi:hypothetical protein
VGALVCNIGSVQLTLGQEPRYLLNTMIGWHHRVSGLFGEGRNLLLLPGFKPQTVKPLTQSLYSLCYYREYKGKGKGNVHLRTGHESPQRGWKFTSTLFFNHSAIWGGWSTPRPCRFTPGNGKGKGQPCTGTETLYRPYGP